MEEPEQNVDHLVEDPGKLNHNIYLIKSMMYENFHILNCLSIDLPLQYFNLIS